MRKMFSFISGSVVGLLVGGTVAVLLAPASGETLRNELRDRFGRFTNELNQIVETRRIELEAQLEELRKN